MSFINSKRFTFKTGLYSIILGSIALSMATYAANAQSKGSFSRVLANGQELSQGLTSLSNVPNGINGSYEFGGKIVYFETRRGPRTPKHLRDGDPSTPDYEIDVRFINQEGEPFLVQLGGDTPQNHKWAEISPKLKDDKDVKTDFELAFKTVEMLKKLKFAQKFKHEHQALLNLAPVLESAQVIENIEGASPSQSLGEPSLLATNTYRHRIEIHHKSCCLGFARHSATIGKYISNKGVTTTAVITCNHGTCANQMALKCSWTSANPGNRTTHVNNIACSTPYNATSVFAHNSNDDTDLQYRAVRYNFRPSTTGGICNNFSTNNEPTGCY